MITQASQKIIEQLQKQPHTDQQVVLFQQCLNAIQQSTIMLRFTLQGTIVEANEAFLTCFGHAAVEHLPHQQIWLRSDINTGRYDQFCHHLSKGNPLHAQITRQDASGKPVYLDAHYFPLLDAESKIDSVLMLAYDVSPLKKQLNRQETQLSRIDHGYCRLELSSDGSILDANEYLQETLGFSLAELQEMHLDNLLFTQDIAKGQFDDLWQRLHAGKNTSKELPLAKADREEVWLGLTFSPVMGPDDQLSSIIVLGQDISREKRERLDARSKLAAIDRAQAVIEFDLSGKVLHANENFLALMGYRLDQIVGMHHRMFVEPAYGSSAEYQSFWETLNRGEYCTGEYKRIGNGGKEVWIQATYNPVLDRQGKPIKIVKFASDVTQIKLLNAEFQAKVKATDLGQAVIEFDLTGNILTANRNFLAAMGYTLREIQGQHHSMFCTLDYTHSQEYRDFWLNLGEGKLISGRFHRMGKFSRDVWIQATYNPILDLNGRPYKVVKYAYDVTKEVQLEQHIKQKSTEMAASVTKLIDSIHAISGHSGTASDRVKETSMVAQEGFQAIKESIQVISQIQDSSNKISSIVKVISDIASQTNLLAFNAAIEAARAGQHGVGFSVVASEVRKLAERCAQAAKEISDIIQESGRQVQKGASISHSAASNFEDIIASVDRMVDSVSHIANVTSSQNSTAQEVSGLITALNRLS